MVYERQHEQMVSQVDENDVIRESLQDQAAYLALGRLSVRRHIRHQIILQKFKCSFQTADEVCA